MRAVCKRLLALLMTTAVLLCAIAGAFPLDARAETTLERLQRAKEEKEKTEDAMESTQGHRDSLKIAQDSLLGELSSLNDELANVSTNLELIEADIDSKEQEIAKTQSELEQAIEKEETQYANMKLRVKMMYERSLNGGDWDILLSAKSFSDFLNRSEYIAQINEYDQKMLSQYEESRKAVEETKARLETELTELNGLKEDAAAEQKRVAGLVKKTSDSVADYKSQIADAEATIDTLEDMIDAQEASIAALQKQYEEELALSRLAAQSAWRDISSVTFEEGDRKLLANLIYCEAGAEPYTGQVAVGAVVINRVLSSRYPDTVVGVIYQNKQFSPVASGRLALALANDSATANCYKAADEAMSGVTNVGQCVYFRTPIPGLEGIRIGGHIFY